MNKTYDRKQYYKLHTTKGYFVESTVPKVNVFENVSFSSQKCHNHRNKEY